MSHLQLILDFLMFWSNLAQIDKKKSLKTCFLNKISHIYLKNIFWEYEAFLRELTKKYLVCQKNSFSFQNEPHTL